MAKRLANIATESEPIQRILILDSSSDKALKHILDEVEGMPSFYADPKAKKALLKLRQEIYGK